MSNVSDANQIDIGIVLKKLQDRLSEAMVTIAVLEARIEQLQQPPVAQPDVPVASESASAVTPDAAVGEPDNLF